MYPNIGKKIAYFSPVEKGREKTNILQLKANHMISSSDTRHEYYNLQKDDRQTDLPHRTYTALGVASRGKN